MLTIGMATFNDFDGVWFTIQALRLYCGAGDTELIVVDNNPDSPHGKAVRSFIAGWVPNAKYIPYTEVTGTAAPRQAVFDNATGDVVICIDGHVLLDVATIDAVQSYYDDNPGSLDMVTGPLIMDDMRSMATHFDDVWRGEMWGTWGNDPRGYGTEPFEIGAQGLGMFAMRKAAWPGFNKNFNGFGAEEWYIHEKVRRNGGKVMCLPNARWLHRFGRPAGVPYPLTREQKIRNYIIGHQELGVPLDRCRAHFVDEVGHPAAAFDAVAANPTPAAGGCGCAGSKPTTLEAWYDKARTVAGDINEHVPTLREYAAKCKHVTEFGTRRGVSTVALLHAQPDVLVTYDLRPSAEVDAMQSMRGRTNLRSVVGDSRHVDIEPTDMLFIDTQHDGEHVYAELLNAAHRVRKYIVLHDTVTFGEVGEGDKPGLLVGVRTYLKDNRQWTVIRHDLNNNGLMILSCLDDDKTALPGVIAKALNFVKASAEHARTGLKLVGDDEYELRLSKCMVCPHRVFDKCGLCGCPVDKKASWASSECPDGQWGAVQ